MITLRINNASAKIESLLRQAELKLDDLIISVRKVKAYFSDSAAYIELRSIEKNISNLKQLIQNIKKEQEVFKVTMTVKASLSSVLEEASKHEVLVVSSEKEGWPFKKAIKFTVEGDFQNLRNFQKKLKS